MSMKAIDLVPAFVWLADTPPHIVHAWIEAGKPRRAVQYALKNLCMGLEEARKMTGLSSDRILDLVDEGRLPKGIVYHGPGPRWWRNGFYNVARRVVRDLRMKGEM